MRGVAWFDHEWSSGIVDERAQGWDWVGLNLDDGGALMLFQMRDARDGELWAAAKWRAAGASEGVSYKPEAVAVEAGALLALAAHRRSLSDRVAGHGRRSGHHIEAADGRSGKRRQRQHRHDLLGRRCPCLRRRQAHRSRLSGADRLRQEDAAIGHPPLSPPTSSSFHSYYFYFCGRSPWLDRDDQLSLIRSTGGVRRSRRPHPRTTNRRDERPRRRSEPEYRADLRCACRSSRDECRAL